MIDEKKLIECLEYDMSCFETEDKKLSQLYVRVDDMVRMINGQPKIGGWIPCSERLPEEDGEYICTQEIYNLSNGKLSGKSVELVEFCNGKWRRGKHLKVIAWQSLPEAYHG